MTLARSTQNASSGTQIRNFTTQFQNAAGCLYPNQIIASKRTQNATSQRRFKTQLASDPKRNAQLHNATETQPKRNCTRFPSNWLDGVKCVRGVNIYSANLNI